MMTREPDLIEQATEAREILEDSLEGMVYASDYPAVESWDVLYGITTLVSALGYERSVQLLEEDTFSWKAAETYIGLVEKYIGPIHERSPDAAASVLEGLRYSMAYRSAPGHLTS